MRVLLAVAGACLLAATAACAPARVVVAGNPAGAVRLGGAGTSGGGWGNAELVRGLASMDKAGLPHVGGMSCASPGNCVVGGFYDLSAVGYAEPTRAFVAGEMRGTWGVARQVPGLARLDKGPDSGVGYVSCLSAGSCTGTVSCASAGNCTVAGWYRPVPDRLAGPLASEPFVVSQVRGIWGTARPVPGFASLNAGRVDGIAAVPSVACAAPGSCAAGGTYPDRAGHEQAFVVDEVSGRWGTAEPVAGIAAVNKGESAGVASISCTSPADCSAVGFYAPRQPRDGVYYVPFVVSQVHGTWASGRPVPGLAAVDIGISAQVAGLSCASPGNCVAGGRYTDRRGRYQPFVVSQVRGSWGTLRQVPGLTAPRRGRRGAKQLSHPAPR